MLAFAALASAPATARPQQTTAARVLQVSAQARTPEDVFGPLFRAVQLAHVFPDNKTFADMVPRQSPDAILAAYRQQNPTGKEALAAFVARYFVAQDAAPDKNFGLRAHIRALWPVLARAPMAVTTGLVGDPASRGLCRPRRALSGNLLLGQLFHDAGPEGRRRSSR